MPPARDDRRLNALAQVVRDIPRLENRDWHDCRSDRRVQSRLSGDRNTSCLSPYSFRSNLANTVSHILFLLHSLQAPHLQRSYGRNRGSGAFTMSALRSICGPICLLLILTHSGSKSLRARYRGPSFTGCETALQPGRLRLRIARLRGQHPHFRRKPGSSESPGRTAIGTVN
jgi:hypothetical protein